MDRRDFLRAGAVGGTGVATLAGCATGGLSPALIGGPAPSMTDAEVRSFLAKLDDHMSKIQTTKPLSGLLARARGKQPSDDVARGEELTKKTLRSLLLAGSFSDLPLEGRAHPAVQERMFAGMAEMDEAAKGMRDLMASLAPTERADMSRALRDDPDLAMNVVAALDEEAGRIGVTQERRLAMRKLAAHVSGRMKQSSALFLDDCVQKVDKIAARDMTIASMERRLVAQMGEDEFFRMRDAMDTASRSWRVAAGPETSDAWVNRRIDKMQEDEEERERPKKGTPLLIVGGVLMGMSLVYVGVGLLLLIGAGSIAGAFVLTHGGLVFIGGLVTLITGAVRRENS